MYTASMTAKAAAAQQRSGTAPAAAARRTTPAARAIPSDHDAGRALRSTRTASARVTPTGTATASLGRATAAGTAVPRTTPSSPRTRYGYPFDDARSGADTRRRSADRGTSDYYARMPTSMRRTAPLVSGAIRTAPLASGAFRTAPSARATPSATLPLGARSARPIPSPLASAAAPRLTRPVPFVAGERVVPEVSAAAPASRGGRSSVSPFLAFPPAPSSLSSSLARSLSVAGPSQTTFPRSTDFLWR